MLLLHLSDLHFRKGEAGSAMDPNAHLRSVLLKDAPAMCEKLGQKPTAVLISGDLAFAGDAEEYVFALQWLEELCGRCGVTTASVFVVPGNHDVVRATAKRHVIQALHKDIKASQLISLDPLMRGILTDPEASRLLYEPLGPFNFFASQFFCDLLPPDRTIAKRDLYFADGSVLRVWGLNSALISSEADKKLDLFVDPPCFQIPTESGVENVVICHHPYTWLRHGDSLRDHLNNVSRLNLFGHEHVNRVDMGRDWIQVAASAAHPDRQEQGWEPGYNLIDIDVVGRDDNRALEIKLHVRVWQTAPDQFRPKLDRGGKESFDQTIRLAAWTKSVDHIKPSESGKETVASSTSANDPSGDAMDPLRDISIRFFKLTLSQKAAIAGKLNLFEETDMNQPDFERFRQVFIRARERGLIEALDRETRAFSPPLAQNQKKGD